MGDGGGPDRWGQKIEPIFAQKEEEASLQLSAVNK